MSPLPERIMSQTLWSFIEEKYQTYDAFNKAVREYQIKLKDEDTWNPDEVVLNKGKIIVQYMYWEYDEREDDEVEVEPEVILESTNGAYFTAEELLFKTHNAVVEHLRDTDAHFFEGFMLYKESENDEVPRYFLMQGS